MWGPRKWRFVTPPSGVAGYVPGQLASVTAEQPSSAVYFDSARTSVEIDQQRRVAQADAGAAVSALRKNDPSEADHFLQLERGRGEVQRDGLGCEAVLSCVQPIPDAVVDEAHWKRVVVGTWRSPDKIHNLEHRAAVMGLSTAASEPRCHNSEICSLGDNLGEVLASESGRARCHELNTGCRRSFAIQLQTGINWRRRYLESARNPSDCDSRLANKRGALSRTGFSRRFPRPTPQIQTPRS